MIFRHTPETDKKKRNKYILKRYIRKLVRSKFTSNDNLYYKNKFIFENIYLFYY